MNAKSILITNKQEYHRVLKKLEEDGYTWNSGDKPTTFKDKYYVDGENMYLNIHSLYKIGYDTHAYYDIITAKDFLKTNPIIIYRQGRTVVALDQQTGKTGIARCHPEDAFNFDIGAQLAFSRLYYSKPITEYTDNKIKVGEIVRVDPSVEVNKVYDGIAITKDMIRRGLICTEIIQGGRYIKCGNDRLYPSCVILQSCAKFSVGDKVVLKDTLKVGEKYDGVTLTGYGMDCFNKLLEIKEIVYVAGGVGYRCNNSYIYAEEMLEPAPKKPIIGSKVKIVNDGASYNSYYTWVDSNVKNPRNKVMYDYGTYPENGTVGVVTDIAPHSDYSDETLVYIVTDNNKGYLVGVRGVEQV